jgi:hypothetical protein
MYAQTYVQAYLRVKSWPVLKVCRAELLAAIAGAAAHLPLLQAGAPLSPHV